MDECWASGFSECSGKLSREHLISDGVFEQKNIYVQGFPWCKGKKKEISVANATSKILCTKHNSCLSDIDKEGINTIRIFERLLSPEYRSVNKEPLREYVDGYLFERWLLKVAVNLSFKTNLHIGVGMSDSSAGIPSPYILAVIFGKLEFTHNMGLYMLTNDRPAKYNAGEINIIPIHKDGCIAGFYFHVRGFDFFLSLLPGHHVPELKSLGIDEDSGINTEILNAKPIYRLSDIGLQESENTVKYVKFKW